MRKSKLQFDIEAQDRTGRAFSALHGNLRDSEQRLSRMRGLFSAVAGGAVALGAALSAAAMKGAQDIDRAAKAARRLDISVGSFRALELAAGEAGIPLSALTNDLQNVARELANLGTSGNADRALERLGLAVSDVADLEASDRLAKIADRVQELGLSSGQASAVLRDLGVRNREMVLLMMQGGDAIRAAKGDIDDYGLAISSVDAARIEKANDALGRLGLITQYAGQQLAIGLVPALGRMADMMTNSLREGGALRALIDGLVGNVDRLGTYLATAATMLGGRYVAALVAARLATFTFSGALVALRGALIRTGIGALVVGAGELVYQFGRLVRAAGGFGEAMSLLGDLAAGVWEGIKTSANSIPPALNAVWALVSAGFSTVILGMQKTWVGFLRRVVGGLENVGTVVPGLGDAIAKIQIAAIDAQSGIYETELAVNQATDSAAAYRKEASALATQGFDKAREAAKRLADIVSAGSDDTSEAASAADRLGAALNELGDGSGGGAAGRAAKGVDDVAEATRNAAQKQEQWAQSMAGHFDGLITGGKNLSGVLQSIARQIESSAWQQLFSGFGKGGGGGFLGGVMDFLFPNAKGNVFAGGNVVPFANGGIVSGPTTFPMRGGMGLMGEAGPEAIMPLARDGSGRLGVRAQGGGGGGDVTIRLIAPEGFTAQQEGQVQGIAVQVVQAGLTQYSKQSLPGQVRQANKQPRVIKR